MAVNAVSIGLIMLTTYFCQSPLLGSHNFCIKFLQLSNVKPSQVCMAQAGRQVISTALGGTSRGIVNLNSAFEKADRLQEQKRTGSQYEKN
jgi:hypothetical protein